MGKLYKYVDEDRLYIKHSFSINGRLIYMTYQVSDQAEEILRNEGIKEGEKIPKPLLLELEKTGLIYTNFSGAHAEELPSDADRPIESTFLRLSEEARTWVLTRLECHPEVQVSIQGDYANGEEVEVTYKNAPKHFLQQLEVVAKYWDGTSFFCDLDKSYSTRNSQSILSHESKFPR